MAVLGLFRAGKGSRISADGVNILGESFDVNRTGEDIDTTCFETGGEDQGTIGPTATEWSFRGKWNAAQNPFDSPPGIYPRDDLPNLLFYPSVADGTVAEIAFARVLSSRVGSEIRGAVTMEASGKSNGGITLPTGSV